MSMYNDDTQMNAMNKQIAQQQQRIVELEARLSHAWETAHKAVERGMAFEKENAKLKEAVRHSLETISLAQRDIMAEKDALEKMAALLDG